MSKGATAPALLGWLVPFPLDKDNRDPILVWQQSEFFVSSNDSDHVAPLMQTMGLYAPSIAFWIQVLTLLFLQSLIAAIMSIWTYTLIIEPQQQKERDDGGSRNNNRTTTSGNGSKFLLGYGLLIPMWLFLPRLQLQVFGIRNMVMNFCVSGIVPTLGIFHTMEAMYDCVPSHAAASPLHYALYCGSPMTLQWNAKSNAYVSSTLGSVLRRLRNFLLFLISTGLLQSLLTPSRYQPFLYEETTSWRDVKRIVQLGQVGNNVLHAMLFQLYIMTFCEGLLAATALVFGKEPESVMENPMLESTSPSEFWGERWNKLIHGVLKRGVYIPVRKANLPKAVAVLATFLASSLFHEWILTNLFYNADNGDFIHYVGGSTVFLLWNGLLLLLESFLSRLAVFQWMKNTLPRPVRTVLVVMLGVPLAHCFCDAYVHSDFFRHGQVAFPMILPI